MRPRRNIIFSSFPLCHVISRCHNKQYLLGTREAKRQLLVFLSRYKKRYNVKIYGFCIMDNHLHVLAQPQDAEMSGHFWRTVLSQLATYINKRLDRDSQVFRERYKSPVIRDKAYLYTALLYIFGNRIRAGGVRPDLDPFCSAHWNIHGCPFPFTENPQSELDEENNLLHDLLDPLSDLGLCPPEEIAGLVQKMANEAIQRAVELLKSVYEHGHTIAAPFTLRYWTERVKAFSRPRGPPITGQGAAYWEAPPLLEPLPQKKTKDKRLIHPRSDLHGVGSD